MATRFPFRQALVLVCLLWFSADAGLAADDTIEVTEGLALMSGGPGPRGRSALPLELARNLLAKGTLPTPHDGEKVALSGGRTAAWSSVKAGKDGAFQGRTLAGGLLVCRVQLPAARTMLLEASGDGAAYVNGEPRAGDTYANGYLRLPVALHTGENQLIFTGGRGAMKIRLRPAGAPLILDSADATLPDVIPSDKEDLLGGVVIINTTDQPRRGMRIVARAEHDDQDRSTEVPAIPPMTVRKVPFHVHIPREITGAKLQVALKLEGEGAAAEPASVTLRVLKENDVYKRTFVSAIDDSVQYYAVNPAHKPSDKNLLVLTLHGAGVEALGQAQAYGGKDGVTLVAPTNRRPYGFDWEDIGRLDAMEVLAIAQRTIPHDPRRVVLTGHSMGGHGTWQVGLTFPDRFAAIGPSAGWVSFNTYVGRRGGAGGGGGGATPREPAPVEQIVRRAASPGDTLSLVRNSLWEEVYILHGDADDNVPVREARMMRAALAPFHPRLSYHEQPGAGHWWGGPCVDWPPMFAMFDVVRLPNEPDVKSIEFTTADPAVSAQCHWATIEQQVQPMRPSTIKVERHEDMIGGTTTNVAMLAIDAKQLGAAGAAVRRVELDGKGVDVPPGRNASEPIVFVLKDNQWSLLGARVDLAQKNSRRGGPLKQAFANHMIVVYGTHGDGDANAATYAAARNFAETLYYRGNGAVDMVADSEFDAGKDADRNVILFGNADTNQAWGALLKAAPIAVRRGQITIAEHQFAGDDLACAFVYPRPGSSTALVAAVAGTGTPGMRLAARVGLLASGSTLPDWSILGPEYLSGGTGGEGIRAAGFFANDWSFAPSDSAFSTERTSRGAAAAQ